MIDESNKPWPGVHPTSEGYYYYDNGDVSIKKVYSESWSGEKLFCFLDDLGHRTRVESTHAPFWGPRVPIVRAPRGREADR